MPDSGLRIYSRLAAPKNCEEVSWELAPIWLDGAYSKVSHKLIHNALMIWVTIEPTGRIR